MVHIPKKIVATPEIDLWFGNKKFMDFSMGMSVVSAPCEPLIYKKKTREMFVRNQIHTHIIKPTGTGKSTIAELIPNSILFHNYTPASVMGTITKQGKLVPSFLLEAANKVVVFDEFDKLKGECYQAILSLLEQQTYKKTLGYCVEGNVLAKYGDFKIKGWEYIPIKNVMNVVSGFYIKTRFSAITFSSNITKYMKQELMSRGICFKIEACLGDAIKEFTEDISLDIDKLPKIKYLGNVFLPDYEKKTLNIYNEIKNSKFKDFFELHTAYGIRSIDIIYKIAAIYARIKGRSEINDDDFAKAKEWVPPLLINQRKIGLNLRELQILELLHYKPEMTEREIASRLTIELSNASSYIKHLIYEGFILKK